MWLEVGSGSLVSTIGGGVARSGKWEFGLNNRWGVWLEVGNGRLVSTIGGGVARSGKWEFGLNNRWGCGSKWEMGVWSQQ